MATWCTGVCVTVSKMYLRVAVRACGIVLASALRLHHRCVTTARRILCVAWMLEYLAARHSSCLCLSMRAVVLCLCAIVMRDSSSMPIKCVLGSAHFAPVAFDGQQVSVMTLVHRKPASQIASTTIWCVAMTYTRIDTRMPIYVS
jgi:hypothetical protein